jgi:CDP-2,3-bis-(O-geranylgeranyl)-sn-glycerol synthase
LMDILKFIGESLWFFLPAFVGNQFPGFAVWIMARCNRSHWNVPVSERWLGKNKTWPAYPAAILGALITIYLQRRWNVNNIIDYNRSDIWLIAALFGIGIVAGDHLKSFFKRRIPIPPGERWWPFDQLDFVAGGLVAVSFLVGWNIWITAIVLVPMVLLFNPVVAGIGYQLGLRKVPY